MKKTLAYVAFSIFFLSFHPTPAAALTCPAGEQVLNIGYGDYCDGTQSLTANEQQPTYTSDMAQKTYTDCMAGKGPVGTPVDSDYCLIQAQKVSPGFQKPNTTQQPAYNAASAPAPSGKAPLQYTPLEPLPGGNAQSYNSLSGYLALMFNILLSLGAMIAVITLVLGGITYMVSEVVDRKSEAKQRMRASIIGLLLLLSCWLILNTINPNLVKFNLPIPGAPSTVAGSQGSPSSQPPPTQAQAAQGEAACKAKGPLCAYNGNADGTFSCDCYQAGAL